jgi:predicted RNase H-like nuclease
MRVTGVDACRGGWVAVSLDGASLDRASLDGASLDRASLDGASPAAVRVHETLTGLLGPDNDTDPAAVTGIDMPLGLRWSCPPSPNRTNGAARSRSVTRLPRS